MCQIWQPGQCKARFGLAFVWPWERRPVGGWSIRSLLQSWQPIPRHGFVVSLRICQQAHSSELSLVTIQRLSQMNIFDSPSCQLGQWLPDTFEDVEAEPRLRATFGPLRLLAMDPPREFSIGRTPDNDVVLTGEFASFSSTYINAYSNACFAHFRQVEGTASSYGMVTKWP